MIISPIFDTSKLRVSNVFIDKKGNAVISLVTDDVYPLGTIVFTSAEVAMIIGAHDIKLSEN